MQLEVEGFNLSLSALSGQPLTFYSDYKKEGNNEMLSYMTRKGRITIGASTDGEKTRLRYAYGGEHTATSAKREIMERFALNEDITKIYSKINTDQFINEAINELHGLRVTKNDPWETTVCFVISQFNNIKRIRGIIRNLTNTFGEEIEFGEAKGKLFPTPEALANADISAIRKCGTGFRDKYIKKVAAECASRVELEDIYDLDYGKAKEKLLGLHGIGDKVADCILLFGYRKLEAFPIDTWVKRVVEAKYFRGRKKSMKQIHDFAEKRWSGLCGYSNQYIFWQGRTNKIGVV